MKKIILVFFAILFYNGVVLSQIYGNTQHDSDATMNYNYFTWWRVLTGPSDSGSFTHLGIFINAVNNASSLEMAIYDHDVTSEKPVNLLTNVHLEPLILNSFNEIALPTPIALSPNTYYWIGLRSATYVGVRGVDGAYWPYTTYWYPSDYSAPWIDPVPTNLSGSNQTGLGAAYIVANNMVLPIELIAFEAYQQQKAVSIQWETSLEINNSGWNIQRTNNGISYQTIGWVDGSNNSDIKKKYNFRDTSPELGLNIYRLEQVDMDGHKSYSNHITVDFDRFDDLVFPNPAQNFINISRIDMDNIQIINALGQIVLDIPIDGKGTIDISNLEDGNYIIIDRDQHSKAALSFIKGK